MTSAPTWLPAALLLAPILTAVPALVVPRALRRGLWIAGSALAFGLAIALAVHVVRAGPLESFGEQLRADGLGATMALLITFLAFVCSIYAASYMPGAHRREPARRERLEQRMPLFTALFLVLEGTLLWVVLTNHIVMLWVALEATTLASALLVSFYWDPRALEAGWKYLLLLTVGITSAFFGCVLLYASAAPHVGEASALLITHLRGVVGLIPPHLALLALMLLLLGFGTKAGLAPFHPWVADAHAEAPAVMSAFLSSVIIKVPLIGLMRVWSIFAPRYPELNTALLAIGCFTMIVGAALAVAQDDLKRLHAYSSVSQVGYVTAAIGLGTPFGFYAAVFFLLSHALAKALLFLSTGAVVFAAREIRSLAALGGLRRQLPLTGLCTLAGALSLAGLPPFGGFLAKAQVVLAAAEAKQWLVVAIAVGTSLVTMTYMITMVQKIYLGSPRSPELAESDVREVPVSMRIAMVLLAAGVLALGLVPGLLDPLLTMAAQI